MKKKSRSFFDAKQSLMPLMNRAESYQLDSESIDIEFSGLKHLYNLKKSDWLYLAGYRDAVIDKWYFRLLIYYTEFEGKLYSNWNDYPEEMKIIMRRDNNALNSGFYWVKDGIIGKPYYVRQAI